MSQDFSVNPTGSQYIYNNIPVSSFGGSLGGATVGTYIVPLLGAPAGLGVINIVHKMNDLPADKVEFVHKASQEAIDKSGLAKKGVKVIYEEEVKASNLLSRIRGLINPMVGVKQGDNACAVVNDVLAPLLNKGEIHMPEKKLSYTVFHEMGHQMNANFSKFGAMLQKLRPVSVYLPVVIALFGAVTKKGEPKDENGLTAGQKTKNFIRNNAGKLTFFAMLPMLTEEAMATIKGQKLAKGVLSKEMAAKVGKTNATAYLTYLLSALCASLGAWAAVKIKDKAIEKKQQKVMDLIQFEQQA